MCNRNQDKTKFQCLNSNKKHLAFIWVNFKHICFKLSNFFYLFAKMMQWNYQFVLVGAFFVQHNFLSLLYKDNKKNIGFLQIKKKSFCLSLIYHSTSVIMVTDFVYLFCSTIKHVIFWCLWLKLHWSKNVVFLWFANRILIGEEEKKTKLQIKTTI